MKQGIRHRRLHAFYTSKVLNSLMIVIIVSLLLMSYTRSVLLPGVCGALALLLSVGYSLWFWIKKPASIVINSWLSEVTGWLTIYYLIIAAMHTDNRWWYITPIALSVIILFVASIRHHDETFVISPRSPEPAS